MRVACSAEVTGWAGNWVRTTQQQRRTSNLQRLQSTTKRARYVRTFFLLKSIRRLRWSLSAHVGKAPDVASRGFEKTGLRIVRAVQVKL